MPVITGGFYWHRAIAQDHAGFLWIGTEGGLTRYDGYEAREYKTDPGDSTAIPSNFVTSLAAGPDGRLWVSFGAATGWLDPASGAYHAATDALGWGLAFDGAGALWGIDTASEDAPWGVRRWVMDGAPERVAPFGEEAGLDAFAEPAPHLVADAEGRIWIPGHTFGITRAAPRSDGGYDLVRWRTAELGAHVVYDVRAGGDGTVWVRTDRGFHRWTDRDGLGLALTLEQIPEDARRVHDFLVDRRGLLWLASASTNDVFVFDPSTGEHVRLGSRSDVPASLPDARVTRLAEDRSGVLWFGTTAGLYRATPHWGAFETHLLPESDLAVTLAADRDGGLWAGSICAPMYAFDPDAGTFTPAAERLPGLEVPDCPMRLLQQRNGTYWIGTFPLDGSTQGLVRYDPDTETTRVYVRGREERAAAPQSRRVRALLEDRKGRLWIGGEEGLDLYDPDTDTFVTFSHDPDDEATLRSNVVWSLAEADDGAIWVGAGGLNRLDPETGLVTRFPRAPAPDADPLTTAISWIHRSQRDPGVLWLATYDSGLFRFDPASGRTMRFGQSEGLPANYVKAVLEDRHGRIWAPTQEGLARLDPATREIRVFTEADGLHSRVFGLYDAVALPDGRFVLSHLDALVVFHPDSVGTAPRDAPLALTSFRVFDREVPGLHETIRLGHDDDFFSFEFAALDFTAPEQTRYAYRLDGFDEDWVESGSRRYAAYTNLPPGRYTFRARADTGGGWGEHELAIPVIIAPAWWEAGWFRLLAGLLTLVAFVGLVRFASTRRLRQRLQRLEVQQRLQAERERISQDLHDHVGAQLSTIISGVDLARLSASGDGASSEDPLDYVEARARQTMSQLRETIWAIHRESVSVRAFHERLCAYAREQVASSADAPEIRCTLIPDEPSRACERPLSPAQTLHLYRIAQEAVQNALKHADAHHIDVRLRIEGDTLSLEIEDDGRFSDPDERDEADALSGYGMAGMRRRADDLGAHFTLDTESGTRIRVAVSLAPEQRGTPPPPGVV